MDREFITGKNPIIEALRSARPMNKIWIGEGSQKGQMQKVLELAKEQGVLVQHVPKRKLDQLIGHENHQG
ncbi:RNA methyltransferase substrate-binding domain-containing protein, partial [Halalkalibacterium halodurans]|uniref:RNA methyltransferase substrate-binding domain-containing protein n=1 Tax=Halalkalibacterium halodurans TaxID=86665 RepID=UPI002E2125FB